MRKLLLWLSGSYLADSTRLENNATCPLTHRLHLANVPLPTINRVPSIVLTITAALNKVSTVWESLVYIHSVGGTPRVSDICFLSSCSSRSTKPRVCASNYLGRHDCRPLSNHDASRTHGMNHWDAKCCVGRDPQMAHLHDILFIILAADVNCRSLFCCFCLSNVGARRLS